MFDVDKFIGTLMSFAINFLAGMKDSLLKSFCADVTDECGDGLMIAAKDGEVVIFVARMILARARLFFVYGINARWRYRICGELALVSICQAKHCGSVG